MDPGAPLWLFFLMVLGIVALPGMDMAFIVGSSLQGGRRAGLLALAGVMASAVFHVTASGLGLTLLLQWLPGLFNVLLVAGAAYLVWIGIAIWRSSSASVDVARAQGAAGGWSTFRQALLTGVLNPKAYVFTLAVFPQFMQARERPMWLQFLLMGLIVWAVQAGVYGSLALAAGSASAGLRARPRLQQWVARTTAFVLVVGAVVTAVEGWRPGV
jgi:threonine/homoserine/homoserine lactone efflux protein